MRNTLCAILAAVLACAASSSVTAESLPRYDNLTLKQAIRIALEEHRSRQVSQATLEMAEAQYR